MRKPSGKSFEELVIERGLLTRDRLQELVLKSSREKKSIEQVLMEAGCAEEKICAIRAEHLGYEFVDLSNYPRPPAALLKFLKPAYAKHYRILPLAYENEVLTAAMVEARDLMALDEMVRLFKGARLAIRDVKVVMTTLGHLINAINRFYSSSKKDVGLGTIMDQVAERYKSQVELAEVPREDANENSAPMVMLTNNIIEEAFRKRASDIHIEPAQDHLRIRYRIDGVLKEVMRVPKYAQDSLITRVKIMSDMRIDEKRQPQDGRIDFTRYNPAVEIDLRASTVPTPFGEDIVMRILDKKSSVLFLEKLGFSEEQMALYREAISYPYGMLLNVGPTGSGKTTALYAALKSVDTPEVKIVTAEDPAEYMLGGHIIQSSMNTAAGYSFAKAMKAFMRHDPDIILIGEIRDLETARTAVEASLTGHLVFSTLHTNDAVGTVTRLTEMGIEPYLVADSLLLVCAQRLTRRICAKCKESYVITDEEVELTKGDIKPGTVLYRGKGCDACDGAGCRGRVGIYEVLGMNKRLRSLLIKGASTEEIKETAVETGMKTLRQDAVAKALAGTINLEEVIGNTVAE
ncbi:MAG: GspE/PulE family protein [Pseudomonadota bacterium]